MKFSGELKFPEIDHPGVPVHFVIEGTQAELIVEGESLGRWSLYDVHARRLVASAFQIDLDGTEVTFVADDPIDFAYRGVEHMAETWASLKAKRMASRTIAVRKSRKGTIPARIEDMRAAMEANLEAQAVPRQIAGEVAMPESGPDAREAADDVPSQHVTPGAWDQRDEAGSIPLVGSGSFAERPAEDVADSGQDVSGQTADTSVAPLTEEARRLEEERLRIAEERAKLEEERRLADQREADRIEAYRLEMRRLEAEREELQRQAGEARLAALGSVPDPEGDEHVAEEPEPVFAPEPQEPEQEPEQVFAPELEPDEDEVAAGVLDLNHLEEVAHEEAAAEEASPDRDAPAPRPAPSPHPAARSTRPRPEPAMAASAKDKSGLMGAVRAAFKSSPKDHDHQFIEAPGGIGITRYVCEECGYVSISV